MLPKCFTQNLFLSVKPDVFFEIYVVYRKSQTMNGANPVKRVYCPQNLCKYETDDAGSWLYLFISGISEFVLRVEATNEVL